MAAKIPDRHPASATVKVAWVSGILEVAWTGRVDGDAVTRALDDARRLVGDRQLTRIVVDTEGVTGYELSVRAPSVSFLQFFKSRGLTEIVAVMPNPLVSMFAGTMRLVTKVRFAIYKTRPEAMRYLAERSADAAAE